MHELLQALPVNSLVLDLGCSKGSFDQAITQATVLRFDRNIPGAMTGAIGVQGDAALLPFRSGSIDAIVANHSLEHFDDLEGCLTEIGRVIKPAGALFIAVPDASTVTDKLYRWLAKGGGHVNAFIAPEEVAAMIERATGLRRVGIKTLCSSLSFLNRRNAPKPRPLRLLLLGGGYRWSLLVYTWLSRRLDRHLNLRTSIYGWAFYFGAIPGLIDETIDHNVCIECGSATPASVLHAHNLVRRRWYFLKFFTCPCCHADNIFINDSSPCL